MKFPDLSSLYNIRMRASLDDSHVSGAERLVEEERLVETMSGLMWKAITSPCNTPDRVYITLEPIEKEKVVYTKSLPVFTEMATSIREARAIATKILNENGISDRIIEMAFDLLDSGPAPGGKNMRGAIIMDYRSGKRLEPDRKRGIRISRIDYTEKARNDLMKLLKKHNIYHERVVDALAVATRVTSRDETVAELCISDDPCYTTGYIASRISGYVRITNMKKQGHPKGGRIFFVQNEGLDIQTYIEYLEKGAMLIDEVGSVEDPLKQTERDKIANMFMEKR